MTDHQDQTTDTLASDAVMTVGGTLENGNRNSLSAAEPPAAGEAPAAPPRPGRDEQAELSRRLKALISAVNQVSTRTDDIDRTCSSLRDTMHSKIDSMESVLDHSSNILENQNRCLITMLVTAVIIAVGFIATIFFVVSSYESLSSSVNNLALNMEIDEEGGTSVTAAQINASLKELKDSIDELYGLTEFRDAMMVDLKKTSVAAMAKSADEVRGHIDVQMEALASGLLATRAASESANGRLDTLAASLQSMQQSSRDGARQIDQLLALRDQVEALVVLEREKYLDTLSAQQAAAQRLAEEQAAAAAAATRTLVVFQREEADAGC